MGTFANRIDNGASVGDLCTSGVRDISQGGEMNLQETVRRRVIRIDQRELRRKALNPLI